MTRFYSEDEVLVTVAGLTRARLTIWIETEIVLPVESEAGRVFRQIDLARLQLLTDLTEQFDLSDDGLGVVMRLVDQVHALRSDLRSVLTAITQEPPEVRDRLSKAVRGSGGSSSG
jgi:chaperone modulatory protein CbpM